MEDTVYMCTLRIYLFAVPKNNLYMSVSGLECLQGGNSLCPGCEVSSVMCPALLISLEVYRYGKLALMSFSALLIGPAVFSCHIWLRTQTKQ